MAKHYSLYNIDKGEEFDFGKHVEELFRGVNGQPFRLREQYPDVDLLATAFAGLILDGFWDTDLQRDPWPYARDVAQQVFDWAGDDRLVFANGEQFGDWLEYQAKPFGPISYEFRDYRETESRYR